MILLVFFAAKVAFGSPDAAWVAMRDGMVAEASDSELAALEAGADWQKRVLAMDVRAWQFNRAVAMLAWSAEPVPYRGNLLRFGDPRLLVADAAGPILARLVWGNDAQPVRVALAEAVGHTGPAWGSVAVAMYPFEADPLVREVLVEDAKGADKASAPQLVRLGLEDAVADVRATAARAASWVTPPTAVGDAVLAALDDADPIVRSEAARSMGWLDVEGGWQPLVGLLADSDARVRLQALRSLQRLDPVNAAALPQIEVLRQDKDMRVQKAAAGGSSD